MGYHRSFVRKYSIIIIINIIYSSHTAIVICAMLHHIQYTCAMHAYRILHIKDSNQFGQNDTDQRNNNKPTLNSTQCTLRGDYILILYTFYTVYLVYTI